MKIKIRIDIFSVKYGQNKNHLYFECTSSFDSFKNYYITFFGTGLNTNIPLVDEDKYTLVQMLDNDYGHAPYDIVKAEETLRTKYQYFIET